MDHASLCWNIGVPGSKYIERPNNQKEFCLFTFRKWLTCVLRKFTETSCCRDLFLKNRKLAETSCCRDLHFFIYGHCFSQLVLTFRTSVLYNAFRYLYTFGVLVASFVLLYVVWPKGHIDFILFIFNLAFRKKIEASCSYVFRLLLDICKFHIWTALYSFLMIIWCSWQMDGNTDGIIDFPEFVAATLRVHQLEEHDTKKWQQLSQAAFEKFDVDKDGYITSQELRMVLINVTLSCMHTETFFFL